MNKHTHRLIYEWTRNLTYYGQAHPYINMHVQKDIYACTCIMHRNIHIDIHINTHNSRTYQPKCSNTY